MSGVFSSCDAWSVNSRMRWNDWSSRAVMPLKTSVSRSSSSPWPGRGSCSWRLRSCVRSTALVSASSGASALRVSHQPPGQREQGRRYAAPQDDAGHLNEVAAAAALGAAPALAASFRAVLSVLGSIDDPTSRTNSW